jgi:hypothetical protein
MKPSYHRALLGFATLMGLSVAASANAQPDEPVVLELNAAAGCPSKDQVLDRVRTLAVRWPPRGAPLRAAATIARLGDGRFHMTLVVRAGGFVGERNLESATCESLANAAAVHIALLLNDGASDRSPSPSRPDAIAAESAPLAAEAGQQAVAASPPRALATTRAIEDTPASTGHLETPLRFIVQAPRGSVQLGPLPQPSFGVSIGAGLMIEHWRFFAAAHVWLEQAVPRDDQPAIRADVARISASLRACRAVVRGRFELAPCAKLSLEHLWARGAGADVAARTAKATWVAAGLGLQSRLHVLQWWYVVADVDGEVEAARPEISIAGLGRLGKLNLAALTLTLGSEWIW